ncbi:two-component response regulator-like APRR1 [Tanacetum coccineum]
MVGGTVAATVPAQNLRTSDLENDRCSTVTPVRSPRQVIDALNAEGPDIDIILSEVDLPMAKGFKMLKYITRDKDLRRIPVIMMSAQDEVAVVVKCLRLGAADYLVKPLRTNELLNLWTHMWRRRRMLYTYMITDGFQLFILVMQPSVCCVLLLFAKLYFGQLGLAEKNILNCEFDPMHSDHSDANTNSTTLFSEDDTEEKSRRSSNPDISLSIPREVESNVNVAPGLMNTQFVNLSDDRPNVPEINEQHRAVYPGKLMFGPKKSELRIGQSSAFFTYVKSSMFTTTTLGGDITIEEAPPPQLEGKLSLGGEQDKNSTWGKHVVSDTQVDDCTPGSEKFHNSNSFPDTMSLDTSSTPPSQPQYSPQMSSKISETQQSGNNHHPDQNMNVPHCPPHHMPGMTSYPYYPVNLCLPGQMPPGMHPWPSYGGSSSNNVNVPKLDRREAALLKFRQKRKDRCFDKKIRYVNRKKLAERRPRVRGQFVRKINGINVDLNGQPTVK